MSRNGKAPHGAGDALALMGAPSEMVGTPPKTLGMASEAVGTAPKVFGMTDEPRATPSRRRVAAFGANASIARRLAAAQVARVLKQFGHPARTRTQID